MRGLFFFVIFGLGVDSWRERAISEVRGLRDERGPTQLGIYTRTSTNTRHLLTICMQKATRFDKASRRSRCCGQAGHSLSLPDLIRQSTNTRHWLTICTQKATRFDKASRRSRCCGQAGYSLSFPCFFLLLCHSRAWHGNPKRDVRLKAEHDGKEKGRI